MQGQDVKELDQVVEQVPSDAHRLAAVQETALLDTPSEEVFDRLTRLAARILDAPVAFVSLIDETRHFFKSAVGFPEPYASVRERPVEDSFCQYTIALGHPLVIENALEHPLVSKNAATLEFGIGGYIGVPLRTEEGHGIGNFCVLDQRPRLWSDQDLDVVRDLATSVMAEIELRAAHRRAEAALEKAETAVRARDEMLAVVSHDLRSPLNSIVLSAQMLRENGASPEARQKRIGVIERAARRMDQLIQDLLDQACFESGSVAIYPEPIEVATLLDEVVEAFEPVAAEKRIALNAFTGEGVSRVSADRARLVRVFENLLRNAVDFTPEEGEVTLRAKNEGECVLFSVSDTGPGIAPELANRLFEPYSRGERTNRPGAGLGLSIVRGIVEAHGGEIWCEPNNGTGAAFHFKIPTNHEDR